MRTPAGAINVWIRENASHTGEACLPFPFYRNPNGYGIVWTDRKHRIGAHRLMCLQAHGGPPTPDHEAAHSCGKGHDGCCNPRHLRWATRSENQKEAVAHGRKFTRPVVQAKGEKHGRAKLSESDVRHIRQAVSERTATAKELALSFGVHPSTISLAINKNWAHL